MLQCYIFVKTNSEWPHTHIKEADWLAIWSTENSIHIEEEDVDEQIGVCLKIWVISQNRKDEIIFSIIFINAALYCILLFCSIPSYIQTPLGLKLKNIHNCPQSKNVTLSRKKLWKGKKLEQLLFQKLYNETDFICVNLIVKQDGNLSIKEHAYRVYLVKMLTDTKA